MESELNLVTSLHTSTKRDYLARMVDNKVEAMMVAKQYGQDYWDGDRRYGYGGYRYLPGRWKPVAESLIDESRATPAARLWASYCREANLSAPSNPWIGRFKVILTCLNIDDFGLPSFITSYNAKPVLIRNTAALYRLLRILFFCYCRLLNKVLSF